MKINKRFYKERVALNVLANNIENAKAVFDAAAGFVVVGVLSKNYPTVEEAVIDMKKYGQAIDDAVSIGLGAGDNRQAAVVAEIVKQYGGSHINQVFPAVGMTSANLCEPSWINSLVSPTGKVGYVNISTGPHSAAADEAAIVPVEAAIALVKDMGGHALKYFPMKGLSTKEEFRAVAKACAKERLCLEPTGGIDLNNYEEILSIALEEKVEKVIPHVYSSIIDPNTGETNVEDVKRLLEITKRVVAEHD
ncbi:4-hydroxy-2-ketovalerate aldolase [Alkalihalobacillus alcalophilus ATCC 27647 = CGMCC 1.3604]|uniref:2-dehydro-3-deoxyphosphooctonate aldolase n=1 Tax=Alkalihalobacillus alcalophilus ATCC 27647 = CGMCC 1.3604 TaxID=1218173 RepID=A0A094WMB8_ALKAL|nr:KDGP aldolase family protein [Alkalihalobacillus alcalophilus]KGA97108.1 2-dehydro-3-deoxyphosphooctonate aldolase [Alkalihalobacillus alcalophilus ATCC 27647 = CGMCC 1.3604]MED1563079.1 KDGP aldolase family protein [Alkalihalobacillus alcalophilus]THG89842.1 4-hydroxy-2-ketovalerate aldolase [Alkalihalobacillus alcalophilus ATCC 27647 = CGMCC 1.3604]